MKKSMISLIFPIFLAVIVVLPNAVMGECTCEAEEEERNKSLAMKYKVAALVSILAAGGVGVCLPVAAKRFPALSPESNLFFIVKAFAAGVILSTGFIHVLPDAFESLTSPCIPDHPWGDFPFSGFIAMVAAIGTLMVDTYATSYYSRRTRVKAVCGGAGDEERAVGVHTHATHGHAHGAVSLDFDSGDTELLRHRVISQLMDPLRFLYLKHRGECVVLSIRSDTTWYQIKSQAVLNWVELQNVNFQCLCCVGTYTKICLQSDVHLNSILEMCQHMSVSIISAEVSIVAHKLVSVEENRAIAICRSHSPTGICSSSQSTNSIQSLLNDGIHKEFDGIESRPSFDVCPALDKKIFLSDSWSDIMKGGVGLVFEGGAQGFREHLIKYATKNSFDYIFKKNDKRYIKVICSVQTPKPCGWFIKAKSLPLTSQFQIYEANLVHDCVGHVPPKEARRLSSKLIGSLVVDSTIENPHMGGREVKSAMKNIYGFSIPGWRAWKASEESKEQVWGSYAASYDDLRWYCAAIKTTNPGSVVVLEFDETTSCFQRVFISFKASIDGFKSCRPLLFVDATFLNGRSNGTLLAATAKDGDNGLFPIAIAVVSAENHDNWEWFLAHIRDNIKHDDQIIYISDRNVGLMSAFYSVFDNPVNFFCLFHLLSNLRGKFAGGKFSEIRSKLVRIFTECAYAPTKDLFAVKLSEFREVGGEKAALWLKTLPYEKWAVAYSPHVTRYGEMTSNAIESFNAWIKEARGLPITHMLDTIRQGINKWIVCRRKSSAYWTSALCPSWELQWQLLTDTSASWKVLVCSSNDYEVLSDVSARVDLASRSCSCYQWQVTGFPCAHTLAVIRCVRQSVYTHVHKCFYASTYRDCYQHDIHPIPGTSRYEMSLDSDTTIQPPILKRRAGRPKKSRLPSYGEFSNKKKSKNI